MDWENVVGYVMMVAIAIVSMFLVWCLIVGICVLADAFGLY